MGCHGSVKHALICVSERNTNGDGAIRRQSFSCAHVVYRFDIHWTSSTAHLILVLAGISLWNPREQDLSTVLSLSPCSVSVSVKQGRGSGGALGPGGCYKWANHDTWQDHSSVFKNCSLQPWRFMMFLHADLTYPSCSNPCAGLAFPQTFQNNKP